MIDVEQKLKGTLSSGTQNLKASLNGGSKMSGTLNNPIVETGNYNKLENKPSINNIELIGNVTLEKLTTRKFDPTGLTKDDYVLICGDCAAVWDVGGFDKYIQKWYESKPWTTLYVDGNHENHAALDALPVEMWNGGKVHRIGKSIIHLMRGQVYTIDGHTIFTMGGASSHDKEYRKENVNWWARELPSAEEYEEAVKNLQSNSNFIEDIFSHCTSRSTQEKLKKGYENDELTSFFENVVEKIDYKKWFFGHYHEDAEIDEKHTALYDKVIKVW